jgi:cysteinyl-tRNA synthetase
MADTLKRTLIFNGYEVKQIMNITDVGHLTDDDINQGDSGDDKMLKAMEREKKTPESIAEFYTKDFMKDVEKLNFDKAAFYPRATKHVDEMIKIITVLIEKGFAYEKNGNVFYDVDKFESYGKLSNKKIEDLKHGARLERHPDKRNSYDFALWLKAPKEHILRWASPWGDGYPGWHIECTAMSMEYLGETLDIHTGGEDNVFPHHENEIAQSESFTGKSFANYWLHSRHLLVDGKKMSKSKNNFYKLQDIIDKGYSPMALKLLFLSAHYRSNLNFTWAGMDQATKNLETITKFIERITAMQEESDGKGGADMNIQIGDVTPNHCLEKFSLAINDDLNTPLALSVVYRFISIASKVEKLDQEQIKSILAFWGKVNVVLGLKLELSGKKENSIPEEIIKLSDKRKVARKEKNFDLADKLRDEIIVKGYSIEDSADKIIIKKIV